MFVVPPVNDMLFLPLAIAPLPHSSPRLALPDGGTFCQSWWVFLPLVFEPIADHDALVPSGDPYTGCNARVSFQRVPDISHVRRVQRIQRHARRQHSLRVGAEI